MKTMDIRRWRSKFERRIQIIIVFAFLVTLFFTGVVLPLLLVCSVLTPLYPLPLAYLVWMYLDRRTAERGSRGQRWIKSLFVWKFFANYFPMKLVKTADLDPDRNYIFGFHPHGIGGASCSCNFVSDGTGFSKMFPGIRPHICTLAVNFKVPVHRELFLLLGYISVSKESINYILQRNGKGNAVVIAVGGAAEALDARPGEATLTLKNRKGFVKMAIQNGASLVPVYSFGENDIYHQLQNPVGSHLRSLQDKLKNILGWSAPIFFGRGVFNRTLGILPHRTKIVTVVGRPIDVQKIEDPTQEDVDMVHEEYLRQLTQLYNTFRDTYGNPQTDLRFT